MPRAIKPRQLASDWHWAIALAHPPELFLPLQAAWALFMSCVTRGLHAAVPLPVAAPAVSYRLSAAVADVAPPERPPDPPGVAVGTRGACFSRLIMSIGSEAIRFASVSGASGLFLSNDCMLA